MSTRLGEKGSIRRNVKHGKSFLYSEFDFNFAKRLVGFAVKNYLP
jgi:hypothetical protein